MKTPLTKIFGGKRYSLYMVCKLKSMADKAARRLRDNNFPARVVKDKVTGEWAVYYRRSKK